MTNNRMQPALRFIRVLLRLAETQDVFHCPIPLLLQNCRPAGGAKPFRRSEVAAIVRAAKELPAIRNGLFTLHVDDDILFVIRRAELNRHNSYVSDSVWNSLRRIYGHPQIGVIGTVTITYLYCDGPRVLEFSQNYDNCTVVEALNAQVDSEVHGILKIQEISVVSNKDDNE